MKRKVIINFIIFVLGIIVLTLLASAYINYFSTERYEQSGIIDEIAEKNSADVGHFGSPYIGIDTTNIVFNLKATSYKQNYTFVDMNGHEKTSESAVLLSLNVPYYRINYLLSNGGHFLLLDKKGKEIMTQVNVLVKSTEEKSCILVLDLKTTEKPEYLLVSGIRNVNVPSTQRIFKIN